MKAEEVLPNNPYPNQHYTEVGDLDYEISHKQRDAFTQGAKAQLKRIIEYLQYRFDNNQWDDDLYMDVLEDLKRQVE